jgi:CMP-N,N'-diacetyllegionaminic acid synthase
MRNLGFIPVRGGSKRLPRKNLMDLGGKSITHRAIDEALDSGMFTDLILSTDDQEIINHCGKYEGRIIIDRRDPALAQDKSTVLQVVVELINRMTEEGNTYDTFTIMLATCPFKKAEHLKGGFDLYTDDLDSVISVTEYDFPWELSLEMGGGNELSTAVNPSPLITGNTRSQDSKKIYHPNGAFFICDWDYLKKEQNYFKGRMKGFVMDKLHSQDIDEKIDMEIAEIIINKGLI